MTLFELPILTLVVIVVGFICGGLVKGALGAGLPAVGLPIMVMQVEPAFAVSLFVVPVMISNIWQIRHGGQYREAMRRFWPFLTMLAIGVWIGAGALTAVDPNIMAVVLGVIVIVSTAAQMFAGELIFFDKRARIIHPVAGGVLGIASGASGVFTPTIVYFAALRLEKDLFVTQLALVAMIGSVTMYARLAAGGWLNGPQMLASTAALVPAAVGLLIGFWIRERMSEAAFRRAVWIALIALGCALVVKGVA